MAATAWPTSRSSAARPAASSPSPSISGRSNHEGEIVGWLQEARSSHAGIVINAGAYTHTSIAILDALQLTELPVIEVHLSNIFRREEFRHHSYVSLAARAVICGLGPTGYRLALEALADLLGTTKEA